MLAWVLNFVDDDHYHHSGLVLASTKKVGFTKYFQNAKAEMWMDMANRNGRRICMCVQYTSL
eukprot:UN19740